MSKDYRYQREEWDSVEDEESAEHRKSHKRAQAMKNKKRETQRREKERRSHYESNWWNDKHLSQFRGRCSLFLIYFAINLCQRMRIGENYLYV